MFYCQKKSMDVCGYTITEEQLQKIAHITWYTTDAVCEVFRTTEHEAIDAYTKIMSNDSTGKELFTVLLETQKKDDGIWRIYMDLQKQTFNFPYETSFLEKVYEWSIEITDKEIIYHNAGIAVAREQFTYEVPSKKKKFDNDELSSWTSCGLSLSADRYAINISQCMADSQNQLQSPYVLMDESHMKLLLSAYRSWEEEPYYLFAPFGKNIILSSDVQQKEELVRSYHTDYRNEIYLVQVASRSSYDRKKIDEREGFTWYFLAVRML